MSSATTGWLEVHERHTRERAVTNAALDEMASIGRVDVLGLIEALRKAVEDFAGASDHAVSVESVSIAVGAFGSEVKRIHVGILQDSG